MRVNTAGTYAPMTGTTVTVSAKSVTWSASTRPIRTAYALFADTFATMTSMTLNLGKIPVGVYAVAIHVLIAILKPATTSIGLQARLIHYTLKYREITSIIRKQPPALAMSL